MKKILVITMTMNRVDTTRQYISGLALKGGCEFKHIVVDNGSKDGTVEYLKEQGFDVVENKENEGIVKAWIRGVNFAIEQGFVPDYIVKFDDDCEIISKNILKQIMKFFEENGDKYIVAPIDLNITPDYVPKTVDPKKKIGSFNVNITTHTGGMLVAMPYEAFRLMAEHKVEMDIVRGVFWRERGYSNVYLKDLKARHVGVGAKIGKYKY